ncbi:M55 family metallopeptidase [bacterium]|nr:M55 family metallopeptidase [bacterium]
MNVLVMTDLEGVAGVVDFESQSYASGKYYEQAKHLLTAEVNAAVEGLRDGGAVEILVLDMHGPGGIVYEELASSAWLFHGRPIPPRWFDLDFFHHADAAVMIGQHAMAGVPDATLNHTMDSRAIASYRINDRPVGEIGLFALCCGAHGVPLVFLSGDAGACLEARDLIPNIHPVSVKKGLSRTCAISLPAKSSRNLIKAGAQEALRRQKKDPVQPLVWPGPHVLEKRFFTTTQADEAEKTPGVERVDALTVRIQGEKILDVVYR